MRLLLLLIFAFLLAPVAAQAEVTVLSAKNGACNAINAPYTPIEERYERGIIFRLERCGYPENYVMGTMHSDSPRLEPIFSDARAVIKGLRAVGFEFVEDAQTSVVAAQYMFFPASASALLNDMLTPKRFELLADALHQRLQFPRAAAERLRPWAASITLQYPPPVADGVVFDKRLQDYARSLGKEMFSIESPAEQFAIFSAIPYKKQLIMLNDTIDSIDELDASNEAFMQAFIQRDLKTLHQLAEQSFAMTSDVELREYIEQKLLYERNSSMAARIAPRLRKGNTMVAIGALHLMGEQGILAHLEKQGWRVEVVR
jgi:uncharacterized protein YbaP (TraB family)